MTDTLIDYLKKRCQENEWSVDCNDVIEFAEDWVKLQQREIGSLRDVADYKFETLDYVNLDDGVKRVNTSDISVLKLIEPALKRALAVLVYIDEYVEIKGNQVLMVHDAITKAKAALKNTPEPVSLKDTIAKVDDNFSFEFYTVKEVTQGILDAAGVKYVD